MMTCETIETKVCIRVFRSNSKKAYDKAKLMEQEGYEMTSAETNSMEDSCVIVLTKLEPLDEQA